MSLRDVPRYIPGQYHFTSPLLLLATSSSLVQPSTTVLAPKCPAEWFALSMPVGPPMTYVARPGAKQFVVIAAGGHAKIREEPQRDALVGFALP